MSYLFWLSTLIPGFALLQTAFVRDIRCGLLGTMAWSFVLTVALTTPLVIIAFVFHFTLPFVGYGYVILLALGCLHILRPRCRADIQRLFRAIYWPECGIVVGVIAITAYLGGSVTSDSLVHIAKIRYLQEIGFSLQDPFSPLAIVESRHHVNTYQALHALGAWVSGEDPLEVWFKSAWFFKLLACGGIEFLVVTIWHSRWAGAVATVAALGYVSSQVTSTFPNAVTGMIVLPLFLAHVLQVLARPTRRGLWKVALASLVLGAIHVGHWFVFALCLLPTLCGWMLWRSRLTHAWLLGVETLVAIFAGAPFLLITIMQPQHADEQNTHIMAWMLRGIQFGTQRVWQILDPGQFLWMLPVVAGSVFFLSMQKRYSTRCRAIALITILLTSLLAMFTPLLFDVLTRLMPHWLLRRAMYIAILVGFVVIPGGLAWMAQSVLHTRTSQLAFLAMILCAGLVIFKPAIVIYYKSQGIQWQWFQKARQLQRLCQDWLSRRPLVAANPVLSLMLPAVHLTSVMAPLRVHANPADGDLMQRYHATTELFATETSPERRRAILAQHHIDFILLGPTLGPGMTLLPLGTPIESTQDFGDLVAAQHGFQLFKVRH